jgi:hypothetical protein
MLAADQGAEEAHLELATVEAIHEDAIARATMDVVAEPMEDPSSSSDDLEMAVVKPILAKPPSSSDEDFSAPPPPDHLGREARATPPAYVHVPAEIHDVEAMELID